MIPKFTKTPDNLTAKELRLTKIFWINMKLAPAEAFKENEALLNGIRAAKGLSKDFKAYCEYLFYDQMTKFRDMHINYALGFHMKLERLFDFTEDIKIPKRL